MSLGERESNIAPSSKSRRLHIRLHPEKDADIIDYLDNQKHITNFIKMVVRERIWEEKLGAESGVLRVPNFGNSYVSPSPNYSSAPLTPEQGIPPKKENYQLDIQAVEEEEKSSEDLF